MCDLPMSKLFLLCFRIQTKVRSKLSSSLSRIISLVNILTPLTRIPIKKLKLNLSLTYSKYVVGCDIFGFNFVKQSF